MTTMRVCFFIAFVNAGLNVAKYQKQKSARLSHDASHTNGLTCTGANRFPAHFLAFPAHREKVSNLTLRLQKEFCPVVGYDSVRNTPEDLQSWESKNLIGDEMHAFPQSQLLKYASVQWSVREMWTAHLSSDSNYAGFFEEDATFRDDFSQRYAAVVEALADNDADLVYLGHCDEWCQTGGVDLGGDTRMVKSTYPNCVQGYILSKKGARFLLDNTAVMTDLYDNNMREACRNEYLKCLSVCPKIVGQGWSKWGYDHPPLPAALAVIPPFWARHVTIGSAMILAMILAIGLRMGIGQRYRAGCNSDERAQC